MTCGIYRIEHTESGRTYIGRSGNVHARLEQHRASLRRGKHDNPQLQKAWNEHGADAFEFAIVEQCDSADVEERERYHIARFTERPAGTYNRTPAAGGMPSHDREAITVYLDADVKRKLKAYCNLEDREMSQFVNELVAGELEDWTPDF